MDCEKFENLMIPLLDGELSGPEEVEMGRHVEACSNCREEKELLEKIWASLDAYVPPDISEDFNARLMAKIHAAPAEIAEPMGITAAKSSQRSLWARPTVWVAAATLLLASLLTISLMTPELESGDPLAGGPTKGPDNVPRVIPPKPPIAAADKAVIDNLDILVNMDMLEDMELIEAMDALEADMDTNTDETLTLAYLYDFDN